jgi:hypothetical protein
VEELYFFRRYDEAVEFVRKIFSEEGNGSIADGATTDLLKLYESKCLEKVKRPPSVQ